MKLPHIVAAWLCLGACSVILGGRPETCGDYPQGGGPAVISTKDQQVCDVVRLRIGRALDLDDQLTRDEIDRLVQQTLVWEKKATVDRLVDAVRKDAGDTVATELRRAIDSVLAQSSLPLPAACTDAERCLVKGAARGARIALLYATPRKADVMPMTEGAGGK